ncbi:ISH9-type transposase ISHwa3 [Halococcus hamelinensis 100A6]|uniref:ISH9-type transposase ISHwa3 n=1 Tax=Halococcus hamelinensis 100A6 TaxID=1132509 RepID=M0LWD9_9EURY|nr:ISH9-type transposase ISHwa3 [Halococcus hamelinensis 100A6]
MGARSRWPCVIHRFHKNARKRLRELETRPLIKHCVCAPYDHAHNARIDEDIYAQRSMTETVNSAMKRSLGYVVRACDWWRVPRDRSDVYCLQHQTLRHTVKSTALQRFNRAKQT